MPEFTTAELNAVSIPWHKVACILKAVAKFWLCEQRGGNDCLAQLGTDIRECLR